MEDFDPIALRHQLHRFPELSHQEHRTTRVIAETLEAFGARIVECGLTTGVVADIGHGEPIVALRADIDGLPVEENASHALRSENAGVMHACGHDLHMAALLSAAWRFAQDATLPGTIRLLFQPAEETGNGSAELIDAGVLDGVSAVIGFHNNPNYAPGHIALGRAMMAGCVRFAVELHATGSHGAYPHKGTSPIEPLAAMVTQLQTVVSRSVGATDPAVLSVTEIHGGDVWNVIPTHAGFSGTVRTFSEQVESTIEQRFRTIVTSIARAFGITAHIEWERLARPLRNDPALLAIAEKSVPQYATLDPLYPSMAGEDFAEYGAKAPLLFAFVGSNGTPGAADWHSPDFIGDDATVATAADFYTVTATALITQMV
ncbi:MAG: amidohydrolase [Ancrocorticia sp.]|jgi:amidohydrolase|nr:amidohydrolase [Ancrocorticia sp.]MCI2192665.1 amidohydrolase [Ancrocorticia sp.]MCI2199269.1 amidohydrolase [Ancrocorticia sp.]